MKHKTLTMCSWGITQNLRPLLTFLTALMKLRFATILSLVLIMSNVFAQQKVDYKTETAIPYYSIDIMQDNEYMQTQCVLDFYYPSNIGNYPTIVWFHGGGLNSGRREIPEYLKNKGVAVVGVGYRLSPAVRSAEAILDAAAATAWVFNNIGKYGGNNALIFVSGMSAGGYLTYMVGLDKKYLAAHAIDANQIAGLIPFSGHAITHFSVRGERGIPDTQPIIDEMAPLFHLYKLFCC